MIKIFSIIVSIFLYLDLSATAFPPLREYFEESENKAAVLSPVTKLAVGGNIATVSLLSLKCWDPRNSTKIDHDTHSLVLIEGKRALSMQESFKKMVGTDKTCNSIVDHRIEPSSLRQKAFELLAKKFKWTEEEDFDAAIEKVCSELFVPDESGVWALGIHVVPTSPAIQFLLPHEIKERLSVHDVPESNLTSIFEKPRASWKGEYEVAASWQIPLHQALYGIGQSYLLQPLAKFDRLLVTIPSIFSVDDEDSQFTYHCASFADALLDVCLQGNFLRGRRLYGPFKCSEFKEKIYDHRIHTGLRADPDFFYEAGKAQEEAGLGSSEGVLLQIIDNEKIKISWKCISSLKEKDEDSKSTDTCVLL